MKLWVLLITWSRILYDTDNFTARGEIRSMDWIQLAWDKVRWWDLVNTVINLWGP
jgi:hypothetical protein